MVRSQQQHLYKRYRTELLLLKMTKTYWSTSPATWKFKAILYRILLWFCFVFFLDWFQKIKYWWSHHFSWNFIQIFTDLPIKSAVGGSCLITSLNFEFLNSVFGCCFTKFLAFLIFSLLQEGLIFCSYFPNFDIDSEISPPLNGHSGPITRTGHFLVASLDSLSLSCVGSTILAISCPGWQAQWITEIRE